MPPATYVVTGAFGYSGRYITQRLLARGHSVRTLTSIAGRPDPFGGKVPAFPYDFDRPDDLRAHLAGARTLINTYWIRFPYRGRTFADAVANTKALLQAAVEAGVERIVHVSIANPSLNSPLPYYSGKAQVEQAILASGLSYAILRPTVIFGNEDILINNIAWIARHFPVFGIPGDGQYRLQPIFVEDLADLAVAAADSTDNQVLDACGPETFTFDELVRLIARTVGRTPRLVHLPPSLALLFSGIIGRLVGDVVLTRQEVQGLMANLLASDEPPLGATRLSDWLAQNADTVGRRYASEVQRHYR